MDLAYIVLGLLILILGGDYLLKAAIGFSVRLKIPKIIVGMTVVSFATSAPELIITIKSALQAVKLNNPGLSDFAISSVIGSNIVNLGLVLGVIALLSKIRVEDSFYRIYWPSMTVISFALFGFLYFNGELSRLQGIIFIVLLVIFSILMIRIVKNFDTDKISNTAIETPVYKDTLYLIIGGVALWLGSKWLIEGAVNLAKDLGISERVIGISIVALGTSMPELSASIVSVIKKEKSISVGTLVGANIFNILGVLGITATIVPLRVSDPNLLSIDIFWMLAFAIVILPLSLFFNKKGFYRVEGIILLLMYILFLFQTIK